MRGKEIQKKNYERKFSEVNKFIIFPIEIAT